MKFKLWLENEIHLWLDDERNPNDPTYQDEDFRAKPGMVWVKTVQDAKEILKTGKVASISFDNDLGLPEEGRHLAKWIEEEAFFERLPPLQWSIHSRNPEGARQITLAMQSAERFWNR